MSVTAASTPPAATAPNAPASPSRRSWSPLAPVRQRFRRWWLARLRASDTLTLTQGNVYILPTGAGWMLALTLLVLLVASINFQLNLGYLLTFLLAGSAAAGVHLCHGTLRGLRLRLLTPEPQFLGHNATLSVELSNTRRTARHGIALATHDEAQTPHWAWTDVPAQGSATVHIGFAPARRGLQTLPLITTETRYPLGTFRVWSTWRPAAQLLVYPAPEVSPPPLPPGEARAGQSGNARASGVSEFEGVRAYRRGDPLKLVVWKKAAQSFATGSDALVSRDALQSQHQELWLDVNRAGLPGLEARISRVTAWVLQAERLGLRWGLRLPGGQEVAQGEGATHRRLCLEALALC